MLVLFEYRDAGWVKVVSVLCTYVRVPAVAAMQFLSYCISVSIIRNIGYLKLLRHLSVVLQINAVTSSSVMCMVCVLRTSANVWHI